VGPADADARPAVSAREGHGPALADQGQDVRGAAPRVPHDLRAADPRAGARHRLAREETRWVREAILGVPAAA
jgi:hypothetical protein